MDGQLETLREQGQNRLPALRRCDFSVGFGDNIVAIGLRPFRTTFHSARVPVQGIENILLNLALKRDAGPLCLRAICEVQSTYRSHWIMVFNQAAAELSRQQSRR